MNSPWHRLARVADVAHISADLYTDSLTLSYQVVDTSRSSKGQFEATSSAKTSLTFACSPVSPHFIKFKQKEDLFALKTCYNLVKHSIFRKGCLTKESLIYNITDVTVLRHKNFSYFPLCPLPYGVSFEKPPSALSRRMIGKC